jgi:hypothetical protein
VAEFCRRKSIPPSSFFAWRKRLRSAGGRPGLGAFVEVVAKEVIPAPLGQDGGTEDRHSQAWPVEADPSRIEVHLRGGRRLSVGRAFDARTLRRLLRVLEKDPRRLIDMAPDVPAAHQAREGRP